MQEEWLDYIDDYFRDRLSAAERTQFEARRAEDIDFEAEVQAYLADRAVITSTARANVREMASTALEKHEKSRFSFRRYPLAAAAAVLLLVVAVWWVFPKGASPEALYFAYYEAPVPSASRSGDDLYAQWNAAVSDYASGNLEAALPAFEGIAADQTLEKRHEALLLAGICQLELGRYPQAIASFDGVSASSAFAAEAQWYKALAMIKSDDLQGAQSTLRGIASDGGYKSAEAQELLDILD